MTEETGETTESTETTETTEVTTEAKDTPTTNWWDDIDEDTRGYVENKAWYKDGKDPKDVLLDSVKAYRELEKFRGANENELLKLPKEGDADGWAKVYDKLGRPESPDKYEFVAPEGRELDTEAVGMFAKTAHELGLTKGQAEKVFDVYTQYETQMVEQQRESIKQQSEQEIHDLKKEWGAQYDERKNLALQAAKHFDIGETDVNYMEAALGLKKTYDILGRFGDALREDKRIDGGSVTTFGLTPAAAKNKLSEYSPSKLLEIAGNTNSAEYKEWQRLNDIAYGTDELRSTNS